MAIKTSTTKRLDLQEVIDYLETCTRLQIRNDKGDGDIVKWFDEGEHVATGTYPGPFATSGVTCVKGQGSKKGVISVDSHRASQLRYCGTAA